MGFSANTVPADSEEAGETKRGGKGTYLYCVEHLTAIARMSPFLAMVTSLVLCLSAVLW